MDKKLEVISLLRFLPAGAADMGEGVTRARLREAGLGAWSAPSDRADDMSAVLGPADAPELEGYDPVLPLPEDATEAPTAPGGPVVRVRFGAG